MNRFFYSKLALQNLKKHQQMIVPYVLTSILTIMMFFIVFGISTHSEFLGTSTGTLLGFGSIVIAIFAIIFMFYTNSFLIKRRKKEFGIYNILGLEKKHISKIVFMETIMMFMISMVLGLLLGSVFGQLMFLLAMKLMKMLPTMSFEYNAINYVTTTLLFAGIFFLTYLYDLKEIHLSKPIELLKGESSGEKEPKTRWLFAILGIVSLISGYKIALTVEDPIEAMAYFFIAVVLVIIGTYCLFTAGSIAFLKTCRKNKKFYYQTNHFINISGMIYRMKQNAVGLGNICILSTMVLVVLTTTYTLYATTNEDRLGNMVRYVNYIDYNQPNVMEDNKKDAKEVLAQFNEEMVNVNESYSVSFTRYQLEDGTYITSHEESLDDSLQLIPESGHRVRFGLIDEYDSSIELIDNEVLVLTSDETKREETFKIFDHVFQVKDTIVDFEDHLAQFQISVLVKDLDALYEVTEILNPRHEAYYPYSIAYEFGFDISDQSKEEAIEHALLQKYSEQNHGCKAESKEECGIHTMLFTNMDIKRSLYEALGSFFFVGITLGSLFTIAAVLIMYYKQISEGFEDKKRFEIMKKVGLSHHEIKHSISSQVLFVFFMPLILAGIHLMVATPMISKMFASFIVGNPHHLVLKIALGIYVLFTIFYFIVYKITATVYYKIIK